MRGRRVESQVEEKMGRIVRCTRSVMKTWMKTKRMAMGLKDELDKRGTASGDASHLGGIR